MILPVSALTPGLVHYPLDKALLCYLHSCLTGLTLRNTHAVNVHVWRYELKNAQTMKSANYLHLRWNRYLGHVSDSLGTIKYITI